MKTKGRSITMANVDTKKIADIVSSLKKLEYGTLVITVHDGEVTQIDLTEKKRYSVKSKKVSEKN
jgi:hypothetical protein